MRTHVLSNTLTSALAKLKHIPLHFLCLGAEPAARLEFVSIFTEDGFYEMEGSWIHANTVLQTLAPLIRDFAMTKRTPAGI